LRVVADVQASDAFTPSNNPYGEHDSRAVMVDGREVFWKIDTYSDDASLTRATVRRLT